MIRLLLVTVVVLVLCAGCSDDRADTAAGCVQRPGQPTTGECDDTDDDVGDGADMLPTALLVGGGFLLAAGVGWAWWANR